MTITIKPIETDLGPHLTGEPFSIQFTAENSNTADPVQYITIEPSIFEPTGTVTILPDFSEEEDVERFWVGDDEAGEHLGFITISKEGDFASVEGFYSLALFPNYRSGWVNLEESNEFVKRGFPRGIVPPNKDLTRIEPDPRVLINILYEVTAHAANTSLEKTYTHTILQNYDSARDFITEYLGK